MLSARYRQQAHQTGDDVRLREAPPPCAVAQRRDPRPSAHFTPQQPCAHLAASLALEGTLLCPSSSASLFPSARSFPRCSPLPTPRTHRPLGRPTTSTPAFRLDAPCQGPGGTGPCQRAPCLPRSTCCPAGAASAVQPLCDLTPDALHVYLLTCLRAFLPQIFR